MPSSSLYKTLTIRNTQNSLYQSVIFRVLLAQFDNAEAFTKLFSELFGVSTGSMTKLFLLQNELNDYKKTGDFPGILQGLIQEFFLPIFVKYLRENGSNFLHVSALEQIDLSIHGIEQEKVDVILQQALAHLLQISIRIYSQSAHHLSLNTTIGEHSLIVSVLEEGESYSALVGMSELNDAQQSAFNSKPIFKFEAAEKCINTYETFNETALKLLVQETIIELPRHLENVSKGVPPAPAFNPMLSSTELRLTRVDNPSANLALRNLGEMQEDLTTLRLGYQSSVVLFEGDSVESLRTWAGSLTTTLITGMFGGTLGLGASAGVAEAIVMGTGGALGAGTLAVSVACVPAFITCTLLTLIGGVVGKSYAQEYKKALQNANTHIDHGRYSEASAVLEEEFNRWGAVRVLRASFLTKAHFAVAHFFRGMCAENTQDFPKAYAEYQKALNDAKETDAKVVILLFQIKVIQFLRIHAQVLNLSLKQRAEDLIKTHLDELNHYFKDSLTDLHWQAHNSMLTLAKACAKQTKFSVESLPVLQGILNIQSLFILNGYHGGHGNYQQVFYSFFQALTIAYLHFNDERVISEFELLQPIDRNKPINYVLRKLTETFNQYVSFRAVYPMLAAQPAYMQCYKMMKNFTLKFGIILRKRVGAENPSSYQEFLDNLPILVGSSLLEINQIAAKYDQSVRFLQEIEAEFGLHFDTIEIWLNKLCDAKYQTHTVLSPRTQMNMFHMLAQLPGELVSDLDLVWIAADRMIDIINIPNSNNQTPKSILRQNDPYGIKIAIEDPKLFLKINYPEVTTADAWYDLGQNYYLGQNNKLRCESIAIACFKLAIEKNEKHIDSLFSLGMIHQYGQRADLNKAKKYFERAVLNHHEPAKMQLRIVNHPKLHGIKNQHLQIHVIQLELRLKKIASFYPWVCDRSFSPNLTLTDLEELSEELASFFEGFKNAYDQYLESYEARVCRVMNISTLPTSKNHSVSCSELAESAQALWKRFEKYRLQISTWPIEILGLAASSCRAHTDAIDCFLIDFEQKLGQLSDLVPKIPSELGGRSHFFSLGHFLSMLPTRYTNQSNSLPSHASKKIETIQKIALHENSSESICLGLVLALIQNNEAQRLDPHFFALLLLAKNYTTCANPCDLTELNSITRNFNLPSLA